MPGETFQLPVSIGTAIAIQAALGYDADGNPIQHGNVLKHYNTMMINVRTLIRNFDGAQTPEIQKILKPIDIQMGVMADINIIQQTILPFAPPKFRLIFYLPSYSDISNIFPSASFRLANTEKQKAEHELHSKVIKLLAKEAEANLEYTPIVLYGTELFRPLYPTQSRAYSNGLSVLCLTHYPVDLLSQIKFNKFDLLESHTGAIKKADSFYTKFSVTDTERYKRVPFNGMTIQLLGDTGKMFSQTLKQNEKTTLLEVAEKFKWNPLTTAQRMLNCVRIAQKKDLALKMIKHDISRL